MLLLLLIFSELLVFGYGISFSSGGMTSSFDRFDGMCGGKNLIITSVCRINKMVNTKIYLNITMKVKEDIDDKLLLNMKATRCGSKENLDTCEDFIEQKGFHFCQLIDPTFARLSPMFIDYSPQFKCPVKKGLYKAYNSEIDTTTFAKFPMHGYYWRIKTEVITAKSNKVVQCVQVDYTTNSRN